MSPSYHSRRPPWVSCSFYIVTYALAIYNLNLLLGFLTPQARTLSLGGCWILVPSLAALISGCQS